LGAAATAALGFDIVLATRAVRNFAQQGFSLEEHWKDMYSLKSLEIKDIQEYVISPSDLCL